MLNLLSVWVNLSMVWVQCAWVFALQKNLHKPRDLNKYWMIRVQKKQYTTSVVESREYANSNWNKNESPLRKAAEHCSPPSLPPNMPLPHQPSVSTENESRLDCTVHTSRVKVNLEENFQFTRAKWVYGDVWEFKGCYIYIEQNLPSPLSVKGKRVVITMLDQNRNCTSRCLGARSPPGLAREVYSSACAPLPHVMW